VVQFPCQCKEIYEYGNVPSPDGMKSYDAVGSAILVWIGIVENLIQAGSSEKIWPKFQIYIFKLATEISYYCSHWHNILCNANGFDLYICCIIANIHEQNTSNSSTDRINIANSFIQSVAEIKLTAKKYRFYHQAIDSRAFWGNS
jgi:hypothetical protein